MPSLKQPVHFDDAFLPAYPRLSKIRASSASDFDNQYLLHYRELNQLYSLLYTNYDCAIDHLHARHEVGTERIASIVVKVMGLSSTAQQAAALFSSGCCLESDRDVKNRKMAYIGPIVIMPEAAVRNKSYPSFVWTTPEGDPIQTELRFKLYGHDIGMYEQVLIEDHIRMFRKAIAAQKALISQLVDILSLQSTLDRLNKCLTKLKVPKETIQAITDKVSRLDCLWTDSIPAEWLSTSPAPLPKPNKDCVIQEVSSTWFSSAEADVDCFITIQASPADHKQHEQHTWALIPYNAEYAAQCTPSASQSANQGASQFWGMRILKGMAAAGVGLVGLVAGRNDPKMAAGYRSSKGCSRGARIRMRTTRPLGSV